MRRAIRMFAERAERIETDSDREQDVAGNRKLAKRLPFNTDKGFRQAFVTREFRRSGFGALVALPARQGMVKIIPGLQCPIEALDRLFDEHIVEDAVDEAGIPRARAESGDRFVDLVQAACRIFR